MKGLSEKDWNWAYMWFRCGDDEGEVCKGANVFKSQGEY